MIVPLRGRGSRFQPLQPLQPPQFRMWSGRYKCYLGHNDAFLPSTTTTLCRSSCSSLNLCLSFEVLVAMSSQQPRDYSGPPYGYPQGQLQYIFDTNPVRRHASQPMVSSQAGPTGVTRSPAAYPYPPVAQYNQYGYFPASSQPVAHGPVPQPLALTPRQPYASFTPQSYGFLQRASSLPQIHQSAPVCPM